MAMQHILLNHQIEMITAQSELRCRCVATRPRGIDQTLNPGAESKMEEVMEDTGIEPATSALQGRRSPS